MLGVQRARRWPSSVPFNETWLWQRVSPCPVSGCWFWMAAVDSNGYGTAWVRGKCRSAHAVVRELFRGPPPPGLHHDHLCRVPCCVNPDHLDMVTRAENCRRGNTGDYLGNINSAKTICPQGHPYAGANLYVHVRDGKQSRTCKECNRISALARYRRNKQLRCERIAA